MFQEIVSQLSLHPAAVGRLKRYHQRLEQQHKLYRLSLLMSLLLLVVQVYIMIAPPDPVPVEVEASHTAATLDRFTAAAVSALPVTDTWVSLTLVCALVTLCLLFYIRSRQLLTETAILLAKPRKQP